MNARTTWRLIAVEVLPSAANDFAWLLTAWLVPLSLWAAGANRPRDRAGPPVFSPRRSAPSSMHHARARLLPPTARNMSMSTVRRSRCVLMRGDRSDGRSMRLGQWLQPKWVLQRIGAEARPDPATQGVEPYQVLQPNEAAPREAEAPHDPATWFYPDRDGHCAGHHHHPDRRLAAPLSHRFRRGGLQKPTGRWKRRARRSSAMR